MIPENRQKQVLREAVPLTTRQLMDTVDRLCRGEAPADKRRMAASVLTHVLAPLLAEQPPADQARFAVVMGELIRGLG